MAKSKGRRLPPKSRLPLTKKVVWEAKGEKPPDPQPPDWPLRIMTTAVLVLLLASNQRACDFGAAVMRGLSATMDESRPAERTASRN